MFAFNLLESLGLRHKGIDIERSFEIALGPREENFADVNGGTVALGRIWPCPQPPF